MRTWSERQASWLTSWARPRVWVDGPEPVRFTVSDDGAVILPPPVGGLRQVLSSGTDAQTGEPVQDAPGVVDDERLAWEPYNIADAHARLEDEHDAARGVGAQTKLGALQPRYSAERAGLYTDFARLPLLGEGKSRDQVVSAYVEWCNTWGSPGLFSFLFTTAGHRGRDWYVQEKRTGALSTERQFYKLYPEADVGDERYREPARVEWLSREVELLRHTLTLRMIVQGDDVDSRDGEAAREALAGHLSYVSQGLSFALPDYRQGVYHATHVRQDDDSGGDVLVRDDELLARWLWVHASDAREAFTRDPRAGTVARVRVFDSFLGALYHLLLEDLTAGQAIRRCADPKCRVFFRPKRGAEYHDLKCRTRVRLEATRRGAREALELHDAGQRTEAIAERLDWTPAKVEREVRRLLDARQDQRNRAKTKGKRGKGVRP